MKLIRTLVLAAATLACTNALAQEYDMTCDEVLTKLNREATAEAKERFADLEGACMGVVERDGDLFMHTKMVVRRVSGNNLTIYLPATDRTFTITANPRSRVVIQGRRIRPRDLSRGQELNIYVPVDEFTQPVIDEIAFETEVEEEIVIVVAVLAPALPTTG